MEYVQGELITKYCDTQRLAMRARLELFIDLCEGVQNAHQKAIIHRDLKPSNVLVTIQNNKPVPKNHRFRRCQGYSAEADRAHHVHSAWRVTKASET